MQDPNESLKMIDDFLRLQKTGDEVDIWCREIYDSIQAGGLEPDWEKYSLGTSYYQCREVHMKRGDD